MDKAEIEKVIRSLRDDVAYDPSLYQTAADQLEELLAEQVDSAAVDTTRRVCECLVESPAYTRSVQAYLRHVDPGGNESAGHVVWTPRETGSVAPWPVAFCLSLRRDAQTLTDQLWGCGLRPSEAAGSAGQAAAMQAHIKDLRTVNEKLLDLQAHLIDP